MTLVYVGILVLVLLIVAVLVVMQQKKTAQAKARASKIHKLIAKVKKIRTKLQKSTNPKHQMKKSPSKKKSGMGLLTL